MKFWSEWAEERKVSFINFFPNFIAESSERENIISKYFIEGDYHWNEVGHQLIAEGLLQHLDKILADPAKAE